MRRGELEPEGTWKIPNQCNVFHCLSSWKKWRGQKGRGRQSTHQKVISYAKYCPPHWTLIPTGVWHSLLFVWYFPCYSLFHTFLSNLHPLTLCTHLELAAVPLRQLASSHTSEYWKAIGILKIFPPELRCEDDFLLFDKTQLVLKLKLKTQTYFKSITEVLRDQR